MNRVKLLLIGCWISVSLMGCDIFHPDQAPDPGALQLEMTELYTLTQAPAVMNIGRAVQSDSPLKFKLKSQPNEGDVAFIANDKFLKYTPDLQLEKGLDAFELEIYDQSDRLVATGTFQVNVLDKNDITPDLKVAFSDHYEVKQGSSLEVDLLENDAIGNIPYTGNRAIDMTSVQNDDGVNVHIFSENQQEKAILTYTAPNGFKGRVEFIYEMCYGWADECPDGNLGSPACPYPQVCDNYFSALVSIDVVE